MDKPVVQTRRRTRTAPARADRVDGAATRTRILEATRRRLVEDGYARLSVREIAADAGVNHALIGYHFQGKQQLVLAVLDDANNRLLERQSRMYDADAPTLAKWAQACEFYEEDLASGFVQLVMELMGASFHDESLRAEFVPRMLAWHRLVEQAVLDFIGESGLRLPVSARAVSAWIGWFWTGMEASMALRIPEEEGHQREALEAVTQLLKAASRASRASRAGAARPRARRTA